MRRDSRVLGAIISEWIDSGEGGVQRRHCRRSRRAHDSLCIRLGAPRVGHGKTSPAASCGRVNGCRSHRSPRERVPARDFKGGSAPSFRPTRVDDVFSLTLLARRPRSRWNNFDGWCNMGHKLRLLRLQRGGSALVIVRMSCGIRAGSAEKEGCPLGKSCHSS